MRSQLRVPGSALLSREPHQWHSTDHRLCKWWGWPANTTFMAQAAEKCVHLTASVAFPEVQNADGKISLADQKGF